MKPVLSSVRALYRKLEREAYRSLHSDSSVHQADHFFNFCVTAHAMRDFYLEHKGITKTSQAAHSLHAVWNSEPKLVASKEIANMSKHFQLRDRKTGAPRPADTRNLTRGKGQVVDVYVSAEGALEFASREAPEIRVTFGDGSRSTLGEFVVDVTRFWHEFLRTNGVRLRRQTVSELRGT